MPLIESILVALFMMAVVFAVLGVLWAIIRIFSLMINAIENRDKDKASSTENK